MKKIAIFITILLFFNISIESALANNIMVNPFYAISSGSEYEKVKDFLNGNSNQMYFQWGRLVRDNQEKIVFTDKFNTPISKYDTNIKYGYPGDVNLKDYKSRYIDGKVMLSVFFQTTYENNKNSAIDFLNQSEQEWKENIINPMINTMNNYNFDGIVLDFEGFRNTYNSAGYSDEQKNNLKSKYNNFIKLVKESIGEKQLAICIHPTNVVGYYDGYDYQFISEKADYMILMAYDYQNYSTYKVPSQLQGKIKDIYIPQTQPYDKVKESIDKLINEHKINSNKLILGLNLTGMKWIKLKKEIQGKSYEYSELARPYLDGIEDIPIQEEYIKDMKICKKVLEQSNILEKDKKDYETNGAVIQKVVYYYESPTSIYDKYHELVKNYNLAGVSVWRLGTGSEATWKNLIESWKIKK